MVGDVIMAASVVVFLGGVAISGSHIGVPVSPSPPSLPPSLLLCVMTCMYAGSAKHCSLVVMQALALLLKSVLPNSASRRSCCAVLGICLGLSMPAT